MTLSAFRPADLEPSLVYGRTYVTRRRPTYIDAAALLSVMVALIALIPARFIVPGTTDLGRPGLIVGFLLFCWWALTRFSSQLAMTGPQPVRWAFWVLLTTLVMSYAVGFMRGLTSMESNAADRTMLFYGVFAGAALTAADGIPNWLRLRGVIKVLVICGAVVAFIAIVEYVTRVDVTQYMQIPGLQAKGWTPEFENRGSGVRVASTTTHYIELAAYLSLILPFAIHFAIYNLRPAHRRWAILGAVLIAAGIATTISRTGIVACAIMVLMLFPVWTWRMRYNILFIVAVLAGAATAASPKLINTLIHLFDNPTQNSSIAVRYERYPLAFRYIAEHPWLGRGTGTWVSPMYQVMDNQWLETLLSTGIVGALAMAAIHITGITVAALGYKRSKSLEDKHLCAALVSTQLMALAVAATFDSMAFLTYAVTIGLMLGFCGTVWRLTHPARAVRTSTTRWFLNAEQGGTAVRS